MTDMYMAYVTYDMYEVDDTQWAIQNGHKCRPENNVSVELTVAKVPSRQGDSRLPEWRYVDAAVNSGV